MLDKKIKIRGLIFLLSAIEGALAVWSMLATVSYKLSTKYNTISIVLTTIIVISVIVLCLAAIFQLRKEYLSIIYTLLSLSILTTILNVIHSVVIPIEECKYLVLSLSLAAAFDGVICIVAASVLRYYYKIPIPTDKWYCNTTWPN
ncbi:Hypothetical protein SRAE_1000062900 [Strongyloides ratti]|uniref:MARVEL domain-containing protein n=1 Tax=Strongyloides ratti TaxID=34506 RepID=A0A090KY52_STRRB|nr:Hypothetical protein SRAE_1000062900 [Strongyloides ratti]CEF62356.1 Hypothetical protein SRAE_1000062900 [Strongyloides ratti]